MGHISSLIRRLDGFLSGGWGQTEENTLLGCLTHERDVFSLMGRGLLCSIPVGAGCPSPGLHQDQPVLQLPAPVTFLPSHLYNPLRLKSLGEHLTSLCCSDTPSPPSQNLATAPLRVSHSSKPAEAELLCSRLPRCG